MKVDIQSVHFDADKVLLELIQTKLDKLDQFFDGVVEAQVTLKVEPAANTENKIIEIQVGVKGNDLFAKRHAKTFEHAFEEAVEAIRSQLIKHKEKVKNL